MKSRAEIDDDDAATLQPLGDAAIWSFHSGAVPDTCIAFLSPKSFRRLFLFLKKKKIGKLTEEAESNQIKSFLLKRKMKLLNKQPIWFCTPAAQILGRKQFG